MSHILEIFSDYIWPWCYFITGRIEKLQQELDLTVQWIAFPLHPETPDEGRTLEELFAGRGVDIPQILSRLKQTADGLGLPFTTRSMTYNSRRAQELGKWAEKMGKGDAFHHAVFEAYFAQGHNIARIDVLKKIVANVGLDVEAAEDVLQQGRHKETVDRDWQRCYEVGITAVPTFYSNGRFLVGAQSYDAIKKLVLSADGRSGRIEWPNMSKITKQPLGKMWW